MGTKAKKKQTEQAKMKSMPGNQEQQRDRLEVSGVQMVVFKMEAMKKENICRKCNGIKLTFGRLVASVSSQGIQLPAAASPWKLPGPRTR